LRLGFSIKKMLSDVSASIMSGHVKGCQVVFAFNVWTDATVQQQLGDLQFAEFSRQVERRKTAL
jgi:hypothetical protein